MTKTLHVGDGVDLPLELVTASNALLAKKGAGKTSGAIVLLEEMYAAGVPVVSIDPKGDHYGIRSSADGKHKGLPIPVFGGRHGDIPLEPSAGALIADLVLEKHLSCVLDVSEFSKADVRRFLLAFGDRLYRQAQRDPIHLFLEECHEYLPQQVRGEDAQLVNVWQRIVKQGRFKGIGVTMLSQRSAAVNKDVLTQIDNLFVMRTTSPQDRDAVKGWIDIHADAKAILAELPSLQNGECWLWQPERGEPVKFRFRMRDTFDAGATPVMGEKQLIPTTIADVDLEAIASAMAATIEKAKADDPKALRQRIADLERELAAERAKPAPTAEPVEVSVITDADRTMLTNQANLLHQQVLDLLRTGIGEIGITADKLTALAAVGASPAAPKTQVTPRIVQPAIILDPVLTEPVTRRVVTEPGRMPKAERAILTVLAQRGVQTRQQVATLTGYSNKGGGFNNAVSALRTAGYIEQTRDPLTATAEGIEALGEFEPMPTGRALVEYWLAKFGKAEALVLEALVNAWPNGIDRDGLARLTGYTPTGGGFNNAVSKLRALTLIRGDRNGLFADDELGKAGQE